MGRPMKLRWLGNSCVEIFGDKHIVIDPNFLVPPQGPVDLVLVTHEHPDHFDMDCYKQTGSTLVAPRTTLDEYKVLGKEAKAGDEIDGVKILESHCWKSPESVSYFTSGILHCGDSARFPDSSDVKVIFTACFPGNYEDYITGIKRLSPELVIPIHFRPEKKEDAIGLGVKVKEIGIDFRILKAGEELEI